MADENKRNKFTVYDYSAYDTSKIPLEGEVRFFDTIFTGAIGIYSIRGDGASAISALPFRENIIIESNSDFSLEDLRIEGNVVVIYNTHASDNIDVNIGTSGSTEYNKVASGTQISYRFDGSNWIAITDRDALVTVTMGDSDMTIPDGYKNLEVILPSSGITADRTVTLPTLADNQAVRITLRNFNTTYALYIDGEGSETIEGFDTINLSTEWIQLYGESSEWKRIGQQSERPVIISYHKENSGVEGGGATNGAWRDLEYNTEEKNTIVGSSFNTSTFVYNLPAGRYKFKMNHHFYITSDVQLRLYNNTDSANLLNYGTHGIDSSAGSDHITPDFHGIFEITASKNIIPQYQVNVTNNTNGLGAISGDHGLPNIFGYLIFEKLI